MAQISSWMKVPEQRWYAEGTKSRMNHGNNIEFRYSGMPTMSGLKRALERVDAGPGGTNMVFWTSLREVRVLWT